MKKVFDYGRTVPGCSGCTVDDSDVGVYKIILNRNLQQERAVQSSISFIYMSLLPYDISNILEVKDETST